MLCQFFITVVAWKTELLKISSEEVAMNNMFSIQIQSA